jgi:uncharacterized pyridoxamine 5'-phosphate oxidase family protein
MQDFQTAASVLKHRLLHSAKPHTRILPQRGINMEAIEKVCNFLKNAGTYYLATVDGDQPHVRPFGTAHIFENKLYIQTGKSKNVYRQILANGKAEICAVYKGEWIRVSGRLVLDNRVEAEESMLNAYPDLRKMYTTGADGNTAVFYFENGTAVISSFTHEPEVISF